MDLGRYVGVSTLGEVYEQPDGTLKAGRYIMTRCSYCGYFIMRFGTAPNQECESCHAVEVGLDRFVKGTGRGRALLLQILKLEEK